MHQILRGIRIYKSVVGAITLIIGAPMILLFLVGEVVRELSVQRRFRREFGETWKAEYEKQLGSLAAAQQRVVFVSLALLAIIVISIWLYRIIRNRGRGSASARQPIRKKRESRVEKHVRLKRNALLGNYFGWAGIFAGMALTIFRWGIFETHSSEVGLGVIVFVLGYALVIFGCGCWARAKGWEEAIVMIGLLPLAILLVPYVRLIFVAAPMLLPIGMILMPMILVAVMFTLPDRSGFSR
jgi:hypothetical protein